MVLWSDLAKLQLKNAFFYLSERNPVAAKKTIAQINKAISYLPENPKMGRKQNDQMYKLVVRNTRYAVYYSTRSTDSKIVIAAIYHERQRQPH